jgi:hypothetical protein
MLSEGSLLFCGTPDAFRACDIPMVQAFIDRSAAEAALGMVGI